MRLPFPFVRIGASVPPPELRGRGLIAAAEFPSADKLHLAPVSPSMDGEPSRRLPSGDRRPAPAHRAGDHPTDVARPGLPPTFLPPDARRRFYPPAAALKIPSSRNRS